ncbi:hypothetical protein KQX54_003969 [Cotesia glomerata]|uniref:Uncharacterized protein n=1 Tax=Cotesia glomerata TaxID=32391 RepID=A0AAV7I6T9_COTGL|nr:hypothetical protein KQX54_003969 [Cotesia glomerata]
MTASTDAYMTTRMCINVARASVKDRGYAERAKLEETTQSAGDRNNVCILEFEYVSLNIVISAKLDTEALKVHEAKEPGIEYQSSTLPYDCNANVSNFKFEVKEKKVCYCCENFRLPV